MSLKAKIEAVIYAAEEPVTLAQLVGLLGQQAQAELDQLAAAQQVLLPTEPTAEAAEVATSAEAPPAEAPCAEAASAEAPAADQDAAASPAETDAAAAEARQERERARRLRDHFRTLLEELMREYAIGDRGLEIREVAGGYRFATKPEYHDAVRGFVKSLKPPLKLSLQALETLAVVAYKQPVTAPEVSEIRGVDSAGVLGSLIARKLVTTAGRKQVIGRPILYKTTKDFLLRFGLKDISELPSIEEFEKMASELADNELVPEEAAAEQPTHHEPQADGSPDPTEDPMDTVVEDALEQNPVKEDAGEEPIAD
ncbi:MAG: SMC-Scp complex subunit ScpB [Acidobacteriota bacterium]|nr:SMC-Scp complex subunit ScpB [Acidobacteriota bacterium]